MPEGFCDSAWVFTEQTLRLAPAQPPHLDGGEDESSHPVTPALTNPLTSTDLSPTSRSPRRKAQTSSVPGFNPVGAARSPGKAAAGTLSGFMRRLAGNQLDLWPFLGFRRIFGIFLAG